MLSKFKLPKKEFNSLSLELLYLYTQRYDCGECQTGFSMKIAEILTIKPIKKFSRRILNISRNLNMCLEGKWPVRFLEVIGLMQTKLK